MDITETLAPDSQQLDAVDLSSPRTFTVGEVTQGSADQPVNVQLLEFPRVWRPGKSMRRVLAKVWGADASKWAGKRLTLYCDETVMFGGAAVGGVRISHMSDIAKPVATPLLVSRGKSAIFTVQPLKVEDAPPTPTEPTEAEVAACTDDKQLRDWWHIASPERRTQIEARGRELKAAADEGEQGELGVDQ